MKRPKIKILFGHSAAFLLLLTISVPQIFGEFVHNIKQHSQNCSSCHRIPSGNWAATRGYPDVTTYPTHDDCLKCHRADFFSGPKPAICAVCHTNISPRGAGVFAFPQRSRKGDFSTIFPHDVHQDIIAGNLPRDVAPAHFFNAAFTFTDDKKDAAEFNSCAICHSTAVKIPSFGTRKPFSEVKLITDSSADKFKPQAEFFKISPDSHASCFNCHYQNQKPTRNDCASCHRYTGAHVDSEKITRFSLKFNHEDKNHQRDCTVCHIRITQNGDLRTMTNADVPILTCSTSSCHGAKIKEEVKSRADSIEQKTATFQCAYCHTAPIGNYTIPEDHK